MNFSTSTFKYLQSPRARWVSARTPWASAVLETSRVVPQLQLGLHRASDRQGRVKIRFLGFSDRNTKRKRFTHKYNTPTFEKDFKGDLCSTRVVYGLRKRLSPRERGANVTFVTDDTGLYVPPPGQTVSQSGPRRGV